MAGKLKKGSAILMTLLILGVVLVTALSVALVTIQELKGSRGTSRTTATYQTADEGIEAVMYDIIRGKKKTTDELDNCQSDGTIGGSSLGYTVILMDKNDDVIDCGDADSISNIRKIKSIGTSGSDNQRSVSASIPLSCNGTTDDESTKLLLHMDGGTDGESFVDGSSEEHEVSKYGDVEISPEEKKFCKSAKFDGSGDYLSVEDSDDWDFGTGDWTIDFWVDFRDTTTTNEVYTLVNVGGYVNGVNIHYETISGNRRLNVLVANAGHLVDWSPDKDTWYHVAVVRDGGDMKIFIDGEQKGEDFDISGTDIEVDSKVYIGYNNVYGGYYHNGYLDEIRISKGVARWTSDFSDSLPSYPY